MDRMKDVINKALCTARSCWGSGTCLQRLLQLHMIFVWAGIALLLYWGFKPYEVYDLQQPYEVINPEVRVGEALQVRQIYCKNISIPTTVRISLIDGYTEVLRIFDSNAPVGCADRISTSIIIPKTAVPGDYYIKYVFSSKVNPIRTVVNTAVTEPFKVLPPEE